MQYRFPALKLSINIFFLLFSLIIYPLYAAKNIILFRTSVNFHVLFNYL